MKIHYTIRIFGKVQKVGFRYHAYVNAIRNNISGLVRNEEDGSLYIEAEGTPEELDKYLKWCQTGPSWAVVDRVDVRKAPLSNYIEFVIQH